MPQGKEQSERVLTLVEEFLEAGKKCSDDIQSKGHLEKLVSIPMARCSSVNVREIGTRTELELFDGNFAPLEK